MVSNKTGLSAHDWTDSAIEEYLETLSLQKTLELLTPILFLSLLMLVGIPGNALVFLVFWKYFKASSTRVFILAMAVCDFTTSAVALPLYIIRLRFHYNFPDPDLCRVMFIFQRLPVMASAWLLVSVALDRRHRICQALKPQLSPRQALYLVVGSVIMASLASFPFTPLYGDLRVNTAQSEVNGSQCGVTNDLGSSMYRQAENLTLMLNFVLGLIIMVFCYSHIAHRLRKQKNIISLALRPRVPAEDTRNRELKAESEGGKRGDGSILEDHDDRERVVMSTPSSSMATPSNTLEETTIAEGNVEKREESASRSEVGAWRRGSRRIGSRTTLMMFVLTITGIVTFLPFIVLA